MDLSPGGLDIGLNQIRKASSPWGACILGGKTGHRQQATSDFRAGRHQGAVEEKAEWGRGIVAAGERAPGEGQTAGRRLPPTPAPSWKPGCEARQETQPGFGVCSKRGAVGQASVG